MPGLLKARAEAMMSYLKDINEFYVELGLADKSPIGFDDYADLSALFSETVFEEASVETAVSVGTSLKEAARLMAFASRIEAFFHSLKPREVNEVLPFAEYFGFADPYPFDLKLQAISEETGEERDLDLHRGFIEDVSFFDTSFSTPVGKKGVGAAAKDVTVVKINEVSFEALHAFTKRLYTGTFEGITPKEALGVFVCSDFLQADELQDEVRQQAIHLTEAVQLASEQQPKDITDLQSLYEIYIN